MLFRSEHIKQKGCLNFYFETAPFVLNGSTNLIGANASCANFPLQDRTVFINFNSLDVGVPFSLGMPIGVAHVVSGSLAFSAHLAFI
jgi:hypothetical protein